MAGSFLDFLGGIGSTPPKVYGTSAEDVALRQQMASGANHFNNAPLSYLPSLTGPSATNTGGAVYPWNAPSRMTPPTYGGNGVASPVQTTATGRLNPATDPRLSYFTSSGQQSVADLLQGVGNYRDPKPPQMTAATAAAQLGQGGAPQQQGYAPWGTYSRSLAYNNMSPDPAAPAAPQGEPWGIYSRGLAFNKFTNPPAAPQGANTGIGGAMIGNGQMSPMIPPQLPPADGSSPLPVWAGDNPQQQGGPLGISVRGGQRPNVSPSERYSLANMLGQIKAKERQSNATGQAGGYQYRNGQKVGYASQNIGGQTFTPTSGASAYTLANAAGQLNAQLNRANQTGQTGVYTYKNGVKTRTVNGGSSASAYEAAASKARKGTGSNGGNPDWW